MTQKTNTLSRAIALSLVLLAIISCTGNEAPNEITGENASLSAIRGGRYFYNDNCRVCHAAGLEDKSAAFFASDLAAKADLIGSDLSVYGGSYRLMGQFGNIDQVDVNNLKAYLRSF